MKYQNVKYTDKLRNTFYVFPKWLKKATISNDAKMLYMLLRDRMELSILNQWYDEYNNVFVYYTYSEIEKDLGCRDQKVKKVFNELIDENLVITSKQGFGRPNQIYVLEPTDEYIRKLFNKNNESNIRKVNDLDSKELPNQKTDENIEIEQFSENHDNEKMPNSISGKITGKQNRENHDSNIVKITTPISWKSRSNNTEYNKTNINNNNNTISLDNINKLKDLKLTQDQVVVICEQLNRYKRTDEDFSRYLSDLKNKSNIRNIPGYLIKCIQKDYKNIPIEPKKSSKDDRISSSEMKRILKEKQLHDLQMIKKKIQ